MADELEVKLTTETFAEAGGKDRFSDLDIVTPIRAEAPGLEKGRPAAVDAVNESMRKKAKEMGCSHVFKVEYHFEYNGHHTDRNFFCSAIGTGYSPNV